MALAITVFRTALSIFKTLSYRNPSNMRELPPCVIGCLQEIFFFYVMVKFLHSQLALVVRNPPANAGDKRDGLHPWVRKIWRRAWQPTPVFLPGGSHGQRSLAGSSPRRCRVRHDSAQRQEGPASLPLRHSSPEWSTKVY